MVNDAIKNYACLTCESDLSSTRNFLFKNFIYLFPKMRSSGLRMNEIEEKMDYFLKNQAGVFRFVCSIKSTSLFVVLCVQNYSFSFVNVIMFKISTNLFCINFVKYVYDRSL